MKTPQIPFIALACLAAACAQESSSGHRGGAPPVFVDVSAVQREPIRDVVALVGALTADESVMVRAEAEGVVAAVEFEEGQEVEAGTLLVRLRDGAERALVAEAEAQLDLTKHEFDRAKTLAARRSLSQAELDRARAEMEVAGARLDLRRVELAQREIRAPFDGVLGARLVSPGARVDRETDIVQIDAIEQLRLVFTLPEIAVGLARVGFPLEVSVVSWPDEIFPGEVYFVAPTLDPRNRRLVVKSLVSNRDGKLRPGMFANIRVEIATHPDAMVVPSTAIAYDARGAFVWKVGADNVPERTTIEMGIRDGGRVEVVSGLAVGDRVVIAGTHKVMPGIPVKAANEAAAPAA